MMATPKNRRAGDGVRDREPRTPGDVQRSRSILLAWLVFLVLGSGHSTCAIAQSSAGSPESHSNRFHRIYLEARNEWRKQTNDAESAWHFARACFDWADFATNDDQKAAIAEHGIAASRRAIALDPKSAGGYYYLGLNLGQLAQTKLWGALKLIGEMEAAWKKTIQLDAKFDYAGAHRSLTLLYRDAPGWPTSVGSRSKARLHVQKALELSPEYPGNQICWIESQLKWGETKAVRTQLATVEEKLRDARGKFSGERWVRDWEEWDARWHKARAKAGLTPPRSSRQTQ